MPEEVLEDVAEEEGTSVDQVRKNLEKYCDQMMSSFDAEYGIGWTYSYEILGTMDVTGSAFSEWKDSYDSFGLDLKECKKVEVQVTISGSKKSEKLQNTLIVVKLGSRWYLAGEE